VSNGYNFTDSVRSALRDAREEASGLRHNYVGPEHLLLGVLAAGDPITVSALRELQLDPKNLRAAVLLKAPRQSAGPVPGPDLPYTSRGKKVLEEAMAQARERGDSFVGPEHLLLGMLRESRGIAAEVLVEAGVNLPKLTQAVERAIESDVPRERIGAVPHSPAWVREAPVDGGLHLGPSRVLPIAVIALIVAVVALVVALTR
jgi:ATP-dependent Clp protease ATP-binding subunit ClpC